MYLIPYCLLRSGPALSMFLNVLRVAFFAMIHMIVKLLSLSLKFHICFEIHLSFFMNILCKYLFVITPPSSQLNFSSLVLLIELTLNLHTEDVLRQWLSSLPHLYCYRFELLMAIFLSQTVTMPFNDTRYIKHAT